VEATRDRIVDGAKQGSNVVLSSRGNAKLLSCRADEECLADGARRRVTNSISNYS
jgi:hypothetical protein